MIKAAMHRLSPKGVGKKVGYVYLSDSPDGLLLQADLRGLPPGEHGFHIHEFGDVEPKDGTPGGMAGQHYDPGKTGKHLGPYRNGHKGDLPYLVVDRAGYCTEEVIAPRLRLREVKNRALIIHSGGDNYSDYPLKNGGGKSRIVGGIITNDCPYCRTKAENTAMALGALALGYVVLKK